MLQSSRLMLEPRRNQGQHLTAVYSYVSASALQVHARYSRLSNDNDSNTNFYLNPLLATGV